MLDLRIRPDGVAFKIHVQPKASRNQVAGLHGDALKIRLTAPPVDGAANAMCVHFLAEQLGVSRSSVTITAGHAGRTKHVVIHAPDGTTPEQLADAIKKSLFDHPV